MANASIRYGARIRKRYKEVMKDKKRLYKCELCGKEAVKRINTSIWRCKHCSATYAGGAYTMTTSAGEVAKRLIKDIGKK
ncbi:MAG: 50S ribosomal protein L37ae [Candidatus Micrarchaeota archaeon]|nr:50S ribosomal protein L37ae [Candidatus Micrarchaeota archaeon]